jgi:hypothetical protein
MEEQDFRAGMRRIDDTLQSVKSIAIGLARDGRDRRRGDASPADLLIRSLALQILATRAGAGEAGNVLDYALRHYNVGIERLPPRLVRALNRPEQIFKAAVSPAMTTVAGWAAELIQTANFPGPLAQLAPRSAYSALSARGLRATLEGTGAMKFPARTGGSLAGGFVAEGAPVRVAKGSLTSTVTLNPHKLAVISTFSEEVATYSTPTIESIVRAGIGEDTRTALDAALLGTNAGSSIRPAGLLNGVTPLTATAITNGPLAALSGDVGQLAGAIPQAVDFVVLMNASERMRAIALAPALGTVIVEAPGLTAKQIVGIDAADFVTVEGDQPRTSVSFEAALHEEDAVPLALSATGSPNVVAAPLRSLFQTDAIAIRMVQFVSWAIRRASRVATITAVTW